MSKLSYKGIIHSSSIIGGSAVIKILIGMVRTKFVAVLLGPSGVGLMGTYNSLVGIITIISGMGISSSGVRQVAEAVGSGNNEKIATSVFTLRRVVWWTGSFGLLIMVLLCYPLSCLTFKSEEYFLPVACLGIVVLLTAINSGQVCVLQGMRRIGDLAKISIFGALNGTLISIPCFYLWGQKGIVISLILCAVATLITSWWFARKIQLSTSYSVSKGEVRRLFSLGLNFMGAGIIGISTPYIIRIFLLRQFDLEGVGIYQSAFALSGMLAGFVLNAMGMDYYPRLTAVADDNQTVRHMVNEQSEISLLLALPGLMGMMIFAPLLIKVFYSDAFIPSIELLRWNLFGVLGRVISWPMGFILAAKGKGVLLFSTEFISALIHLTAVYFGTQYFGLLGAVLAFVLLYTFHVLLMLGIMRYLVGATWTKTTLIMVIISIFTMASLIFNSYFTTNIMLEWGINGLLLVVVCIACLKRLMLQCGFSLTDLKGRILSYVKKN